MTLLIIHAQVHYGNNGIMTVDIYWNNLCKNNKIFQVTYL